MKVGVLRETLEQEIYKSLYEVNLNRELANNILKRLVDKGFLAGHSQQIIAGNIIRQYKIRYYSRFLLQRKS